MSAFHVLCCRPEYFRVVTGDNGHQQDGFVKWVEKRDHWKNRLLKTWDQVAEELARRDAILMKVPPKPDLPDQCFTADPLIHAKDEHGYAHLILSNMNSKNRQKEVSPAVATVLQHLPAGRQVQLKSYKGEGSGDFLYLHGHNFFVQGYGPRSQSGVGSILSHVLNQMVAEVPLLVEQQGRKGGLHSQNTKAFHLDTIVMPLPGKRVIASFGDMHPATRSFFERLYPPQNRIELTSKEANLFITNGLVVPQNFTDPRPSEWTLFLPKTTPKRILKRTAGWGFKHMLFDFEPSKLSGGALHCMFNFGFHVHPGEPLALSRNGTPVGYDHLPADGRYAGRPSSAQALSASIKYYSPARS